MPFSTVTTCTGALSDDPAEVAEMARLFSGSAPIPSRKALCLAPQRLATPGRRR